MDSSWMTEDASLAQVEVEAPSRPGALEKIIKIGAIIFAFVVASELIWLFIISPFMPFNQVSISLSSGETPPPNAVLPELSKAQLLAQAGISSSTAYMTCNVIDVQRRLENLYQIEDALVAKRYPGSLSIVLTPRKPAIESLFSIAGKETQVYFDGEGVIVRIANEGLPLEAKKDYPLISGILLKQVYLGCRLPGEFSALLARVDYLEETSPELLAAISEIAINYKQYGGFDLCLYPVYNSARFLVKSDLSDNDLKMVALTLDVFKKAGLNVKQVDLRSGAASFIEGEGNGD